MTISPYMPQYAPRLPWDFEDDVRHLADRAQDRASIPEHFHAGQQIHIPQREEFWEGAFYWGDAGGRRGLKSSRRSGDLGGLFYAAPAISTDPTSWLPIGGLDLSADDRWRPYATGGDPMFRPCTGVAPGSVAPPVGSKDPVRAPGGARVASAGLLGGHPSVTLRTAQERSHEVLQLPAWAGVLTAHHRGPTAPLASTLLLDADGEHYADGVGGREHYAAGLDSGLSAEKVWGPAADDACGVALWWAHRDRDDGTGRGLFASRGPFGLLPSPTLGYASSDGGGPLLAGPCSKHTVHLNAEGKRTTQGHLWLAAPWYVDETRDAPPAFDPRVYEPAQMFGRPWAVLLRYDPEGAHNTFGLRGRGGAAAGLMRWQTYIPLWTPPDPPPDPPPLEDPPPRVPPLPPVTPPPNGDGYALPGVVRHPDGSITTPDGRRFGPDGTEVIPLPEGIAGGYPPLPPLGALGPGQVAEDVRRQLHPAPIKRGVSRVLHLYTEAHAGALAFVPRHSKRDDLRYELSPSEEQLLDGPGSAPPVLRLDVVGAEKGAAWRHERAPGLGRYATGDGYGAAVLMPPAWDADLFDDDSTSGAVTPEVTNAPAWLLWGVRLAFGQMFRTGPNAGKLRLGYSFAEESGELFIRHHAQDATETTIATLDSAGMLVSGNLRQDGGAFGVFGGNLASQGAAIADASGGATVDAEARAALNALLAIIRSAGFIAT